MTGSLADHANVDVLAQRARDGDADARQRLRALLFGSDRRAGVRAAAPLVELGDADALRRLLADYFSERAALARAALERAPDALFARAEGMLAAWTDVDMRRALCDLLGVRGLVAAVPTLTRVADLRDAHLATAALTALVRMGRVDLAPRWLARLSAERADTRIPIVGGLGELTRPLPLELVVPLLRDPCATIVVVACEYLVDHGPAAPLSPLRELLDRETARRRGELPPWDLEQNGAGLATAFVELLVASGAAERMRLPPELRAEKERLERDAWRDPSLAVSLGLLEVLRHVPSEAADVALGRRLRDPSPALRDRALLLLAERWGAALATLDWGVDVSADDHEVVRWRWQHVLDSARPT